MQGKVGLVTALLALVLLWPLPPFGGGGFPFPPCQGSYFCKLPLLHALIPKLSDAQFSLTGLFSYKALEMDIAMEKWNRGRQLRDSMKKTDAIIKKVKFYALCSIGIGSGFALITWAVYRILTVDLG